MPLADLASRYESNLLCGLTTDQILLNREEYGSNQLDEPEQDPVWRIFLVNMSTPVILLLLVAAIVTLAFQEWAERNRYPLRRPC